MPKPNRKPWQRIKTPEWHLAFCFSFNKFFLSFTLKVKELSTIKRVGTLFYSNLTKLD